MDKIAVGPGYSKGVVDLDAPAEQNIRNLAKAKGVQPADITALIMDRPRHADLIAAVRKTGASVALITDGGRRRRDPYDRPENTDRYLYRDRRGARRGARRVGAALHGRPDAVPTVLDTEEKARARAQDGHQGPAQEIRDRGHGEGDCLFAATGVTTGSMLNGVRFRKDVIETETVVMRSVTGTVRWIRAEHPSAREIPP
jgi:fructose-1,6-bisphosphatase II / sedoheptulose-1,7-bisphosphatase